MTANATIGHTAREVRATRTVGVRPARTNSRRDAINESQAGTR